MVDGLGNFTGQVVVSEIEAVKPEKGRYGSRKVAGEVVVGEEEELEGSEVREVGNGAGEAVPLQAENSELRQPSQRRQRAAKAEVLENEPRDPAPGAGDSDPGGARVGG